MSLQLYNTLTRKKEEFRPIDPNNVRMYVCGPTVYDRAHLGNARSVVVYDVLYRLLNHLYPKVTYVRNITDVDDKINNAAKERKISIQQLTKEMTGWFHEDMTALNVLPPTQEPKATEHIQQMIDMITLLIDNDRAYVAQGHVLFSVASCKLQVAGKTGLQPATSNLQPYYYGMLSGRVQEELESGSRVKVESYKRDPNDFVLWKPADAEDDISSVFDSPWGKGRPGWHIECSAMSIEYLGQDFDIHGGGSDLMFPHHENEIAQSCGAYPHSHFAHYWVHNGFLTVNGEKMSKSLGNFITVRDLLNKGVKGEVIRFALLSVSYNKPLDWSDKFLSDAQKVMDRLYRMIEPYKKENLTLQSHHIYSGVVEALMNDLNTPLALSLFQGLESEPTTILATAQLLGLLETDPKIWFKGTTSSADSKIVDLVNARIAAKKAKNWAEADKIRNELKAQGIILEDRPDGTTDWRRE